MRVGGSRETAYKPIYEVGTKQQVVRERDRVERESQVNRSRDGENGEIEGERNGERTQNETIEET